MSSTKMNKAIIIATLFAASCLLVSASDLVVLDMTERNRTAENEISGDYSRQLYSATYLCDIAGYDYIITQNLEEALNNRGG